MAPICVGLCAGRLYMCTADGGVVITETVSQTYHVFYIGWGRADHPALVSKEGALVLSEFPGAVHGFMSEDSIENNGVVLF